jgi:phosphatidylserine synthase
LFDGWLRRQYAPLLQGTGHGLHRIGITAGFVTFVAFVLGLGSAIALLVNRPGLALGLWLANRFLDGLDGVVAKASGTSSDLGGYLDFLADVAIYGAITASLAYLHESERIIFIPLLALLSINYVAHLSLGTLLEKRSQVGTRNQRTLTLVPGIAEGFETIVAFSIMIIMPEWVHVVAWIFALMIVASIVQRLIMAVTVLREPAP